LRKLKKITYGNVLVHCTTEFMAPTTFIGTFILSVKRLFSQQHIHNTIEL